MCDHWVNKIWIRLVQIQQNLREPGGQRTKGHLLRPKNVHQRQFYTIRLQQQVQLDHPQL